MMDLICYQNFNLLTVGRILDAVFILFVCCKVIKALTSVCLEIFFSVNDVSYKVVTQSSN
jgi:hypothetical protein